MLVPLYGFLRGDTIGLIVLVHDHEPVSAIAETLQQAAAVRVTPRPAAAVFHDGKRLDPHVSVAQAGLSALDRVDVVAEGA
jgi:toluene monooxygenase system protein B